MKKVYKTAIGHSVNELDTSVGRYLMEGYHLYGNPYSNNGLFCQALIFVEGDGENEKLPPIKISPMMVEGY